jgi:acyl-CoA reductase-like NAD-dependent aldehyde dehydrogenase
LATIALANEADVSVAVEAVAAPFLGWRRTAPQERIQYLFKFNRLLEAQADDIVNESRVGTFIFAEKGSPIKQCLSPNNGLGAPRARKNVALSRSQQFEVSECRASKMEWITWQASLRIPENSSRVRISTRLFAAAIQ